MLLFLSKFDKYKQMCYDIKLNEGDKMITTYLLLVSMSSMLKGVVSLIGYTLRISFSMYKGVFKLLTLPFRM